MFNSSIAGDLRATASQVPVGLEFDSKPVVIDAEITITSARQPPPAIWPAPPAQ